MAQILVPIADQATGSWTTTPLWSKVDDDSTVNPTGDGTAITSADNISPDTADLELPNSGVVTPTPGDHILRARWNKSASGGHQVNPELELWQGIPGTGTLIATLAVTDIGDTEIESTYTLTGTEVGNITDYNDLYLRLERVGNTGGSPGTRRSLIVDLIELEIPGPGFLVDQAVESDVAIDVQLQAAPPEGLVIFAVGEQGTIWASENGIDWEERDGSAAGTRSVYDVAFAPELDLFVLPLSSEPGTGGVLVSADGFSWVYDEAIASTASYHTAVWSPPLDLFLIGHNGVRSSPDGDNWSAVTLARGSPVGVIRWAPGWDLLVLGQDVFTGSPTQGIETSPDGIDWTLVGPSTTNSFYGAFDYSETQTRGLIIDQVADAVYYSNNGSTWTFGGFQDTTNQPFAVAWGPGVGLWVVVGTTGHIWTDDLGTASLAGWAKPTSPTSASLRAITWVPFLNMFVAVGQNGTIITSTDGSNWTLQTNVPDTTFLLGVGYGFAAASGLVAEKATESDVAFDVSITTTLTEFLVEEAAESDVAFDVEFRQTFDLSTQLTVPINLVEALVVRPETPAQGLGILTRGDHRPKIYRLGRKVVRR
jgi:photosystem II stability/assembly factor-like uncharacterized protein